jgi:chromosome partitioning protein
LNGGALTQTIISVVNQKGGVGKTTTAISVAAQLADSYKVLLIDLDAQGNATGGLGFPKKDIDNSSYHLIRGDKNITDVSKDTQISGLKIICSDANLAGAEVELANRQSREYILKNALSSMADFDIVIIDCPPSLGLLTVNALTASSLVLIPVQTEYYALEGLSQLLNTIQAVKQSTNPDLQFLGLVLTMFDKRTALSSQVRDEVAKYFKDLVFKTSIPRNVRLAEAPSYGKTIFQYDKHSKGAKAYRNLTKEIIQRLSQPN